MKDGKAPNERYLTDDFAVQGHKYSRSGIPFLADSPPHPQSVHLNHKDTQNMGETSLTKRQLK